MSENLPVDGIRLLVEGQKQFISDLNKASAAWEKTVSAFDKAGTSTAKASSGLNNVGKSAKKAGSGLLSMAGSAGAAIAGIGILIAGVNKAIAALARFSQGLFDLSIRASELQGISLQFAILTQDVEGGSKAMLGALQDASGGMISVRDLMTQFNDAAALVNRDFAKRLPEALGILGKVSAATGTDLNFLLESLTLGIGRLQPKIIDNLKIQVSVAEATAAASEEFGKEADALTILEKQTSLTNLTLAKLEEKFGDLPDTTKTLAAQTAALQANFVNIGDTLGAFLVPGMTTLVESVNKVVTAFSIAISEGGSLEPLLIGLGAAFSIAADAVGAFADFVVNTFESISGDMGVGVAETIVQALTWGVELIAAFAEGIVQATTTVLIQAMQFLSNVLSKWLLGASPPKIAPGIVSWGINLMNMYLEGMTQADFGILKDIQGPLKKILSGPEFAAISKTLAGALAGDDRGAFLKTIGQAAGVFGEAVKKLAVANFDLADSVIAVQTAEDDLAKSREKILDSQAKVNAATAEYNQLLRAGATEAQLQAQLGLINAAEANLRTSLDQVNVQEDVIRAAKERKAQLEDEEKLQQNVVDQLLDVNAALLQQEKAASKARTAAGAKKGGAAAGAPAIPEVLGIPAGFDIGGRIGKAIDQMKADLKERFTDIFQPLQDAWDAVKVDIGSVGVVWEDFKKVVGRTWDDLKKRFPVLQDVEDVLQDLKVSVPDVAKKIGGRFLQAVQEVTGAFGTEDTGLQGAMTAAWNFLQDSWGIITESDAFKAMETFATKILDRLAAGFQSVANKAAIAVDKINALIALGGIGGGLAILIKNLAPFIGESPSPLGKGLKEVNQQLQVLATTRLPSLANMGTQMAGAMSPSQMLSPVSNTSVNMNMGGNTFNNGMSEAAFNARVDQSLRRTLRK